MSLSAKQRRAELLAGSRHGANEELLILGHGFSCPALSALGLRQQSARWLKAGGKTIEVVRLGSRRRGDERS
jgi:hypothetical protein